MVGPWQTWLASVGPTLLTHRQLAAAVEFVLRAVEARKLVADVPSEDNVIEGSAWPENLSSNDRVAWRDAVASAAARFTGLAWLSTAVRVLDDHGATVSSWPDFRDTVDGVAELTSRAAARATPAAAPAAPAVGPWRRLVLDTDFRTRTNSDAVNILSWLGGIVLGTNVLSQELSDALQTLVIGDRPVEQMSELNAGMVFGVALNLADQADARRIPLSQYPGLTNAWQRARELLPVGEPTTEDLPSTPSGGPSSAVKPPPGTPGGRPGPYVDTYNKFATWAAVKNRPLDGNDPRLTREQAAAVLRYLVARARAHLDARDPATKAWLPLALALLGYKRKGDAFQVAAGWRQGWTPQPLLVQLWSYSAGIARQLDAVGAPFAGPHPSPAADYAVMADEARAALVADDPDSAPPVMATPAPDASSSATPAAPSTDGGGGLATLLLVFLAMEAF